MVRKISLLLLIDLCIAFNLFSQATETIIPDPTMTYLQNRKEWILSDEKNNFSSDVKLNKAEQTLSNYLQTFCYHFWNHFLESNLFPPSRNFSDVKSTIESTLLFRIIKRMPKGGILHIHADSTGNATWLVNRAIAEECCYIYTQEDGAILKGSMRVFLKDEKPLQGYKSMQDLVAQDTNFVWKTVDMITMNSGDSSSVNPWEKFNACFARIENLLYYKPIFKDYYRHAFESIAEDNVQFLELRTSVDDIFDKDGNVYSNNEVIQLYREIIEDIRKKHPNFILKIIISDFRSTNIGQAYRALERAFKLRAENSDIVVGYDLVGFETSGHTLLYYLDNLLTASQDFEKKYQISLPYFFHAGESGWGYDRNPYDAVLLGSKRIGHGLNLFHFPELIQHIKKRKVCIEICPISNQMLGYVKDLRIHPSLGYFRQGVPCVLSPDDPMAFKTTGLTHDFWEAIMAWNLTLVDMKQFCLNSIHYSSLNEKEKAIVLELWKEKWNAFVHEMLADLQIVD